MHAIRPAKHSLAKLAKASFSPQSSSQGTVLQRRGVVDRGVHLYLIVIASKGSLCGVTVWATGGLTLTSHNSSGTKQIVLGQTSAVTLTLSLLLVLL